MYFRPTRYHLLDGDCGITAYAEQQHTGMCPYWSYEVQMKGHVVASGKPYHNLAICKSRLIGATLAAIHEYMNEHENEDIREITKLYEELCRLS